MEGIILESNKKLPQTNYLSTTVLKANVKESSSTIKSKENENTFKNGILI